jgi:predicted dienelactone hydrolase
MLGPAVAGAAVAGAVLALALSSGTRSAHTPHPAATAGSVATRPASAPSSPAPGARLQAPFAVGLRLVRLVDRSRARTLLTYVRYPALGTVSANDVAGAPAAFAGGPYPLIVFAHGFDLVPATYTQLLRSWARAGYVVAAPVLPFTNANAPGGPTQADLPNQPQDLRVVTSRLLASSAAPDGPFAGLIDARTIAVGGHSDGGDTVLAVAYGRRTRDPRVRAAVVLSGAELQGLDTLTFPRGSPPLLAVQGTADTTNSPASTLGFFDLVQRPKYLLSLLGATHVPPYSNEQPQLGIVERATIGFLDEYLKRDRSAPRRLRSAARLSGLSTLIARP